MMENNVGEGDYCILVSRIYASILYAGRFAINLPNQKVYIILLGLRALFF